MKTLLCVGCGLTLPASQFNQRSGADAIRNNRIGQPYGRCLACRRVEKSTPRKYINDLVYKAKDRRNPNSPKQITTDHMLHVLRLQGGICPLTGLTLTFSRGSGVVFTNASLDRISPKLGYVQGNVRLVTLWANLARNALADEDFFYFCNLVVDRHKRANRH